MNVVNIKTGITIWNIYSYLPAEILDYQGNDVTVRLNSGQISTYDDWMIEKFWMDVLPQEINEEVATRLIKEKGTGFIKIRQCSICYEPIGYFVESTDPIELGFDSSCDCASSNFQPRTIGDIVEFYNMQDNQDSKEAVLRLFIK